MTTNLVADTRYDYTHPWWQSANDRVAYERALEYGTFEEQQVAQAMLSSNPTISREEIQERNMNAAYIPPRFGYNDSEKTITDILDNDLESAHLNDAHATDFSGRQANIDATSRPGIYW